MIYTIEELLQHIKEEAALGRPVTLLAENVATLASFLSVTDRFFDQDATKLAMRVAWLETTIRRSQAKAAQLSQELDAACLHLS